MTTVEDVAKHIEQSTIWTQVFLHRLRGHGFVDQDEEGCFFIKGDAI